MNKFRKRLNEALQHLVAFSKTKWFPLVFTVSLFVLIYVLYILFTLGYHAPTLTGSETPSEIDALFYAAVNQDYTAISWAMYLVIGLDGLWGIYLFAKGRLTPGWAILLIFIAGLTMRIGYGIFTDALYVRQHDLSVGSSNWDGHFGITYYIFYHWELPDRVKNYLGEWDLAASYQMYHPMLSHMTWALFMHFNSLFLGSNYWTLYESIRILTIFFSCLSMYFIYLTFKELKLEGWPLVIAFSVIAFGPVFYRLSAMTNNDPMTYFFIFLTILFTARWLHRPTFGNIVVVALGIGLGMAAKLTAVLMAVPVAGVFLYRLISDIKAKKAKPLWLQFVAFAVIVFPLGLFFPIRSYLLYGQPLTYVWHNLNSHLLVTNTNFFDRFVSFPLSQLTHSLFEILWDTSPWGQDYNIYTTLMKSFLFGEFNFGNYIAAVVLLVADLVLVVTMFVAFLYVIKHAVIDKKIDHREILFFLGGIGLTFFLNYVQFNLKYPYACTMDYRYVVPMTLPIAYLVAYLYEVSQRPKASAGLRHFSHYFFPILILSFSALSVLFYLSAA